MIFTKDVTEQEMTPYNADKYLSNDKFHSYLKGCDCEMRIINSSYDNYIVNKYCKTHKVMCSKTGWEIGWFHGIRSSGNSRICGNCGKDFYSVYYAKYCSDCKHTCKRLTLFLNNNQDKDYIYNELDKISLKLLLELKDVHKNGKLENIINYQIKHKKI